MNSLMVLKKEVRVMVKERQENAHTTVHAGRMAVVQDEVYMVLEEIERVLLRNNCQTTLVHIQTLESQLIGKRVFKSLNGVKDAVESLHMLGETSKKEYELAKHIIESNSTYKLARYQLNALNRQEKAEPKRTPAPKPEPKTEPIENSGNLILDLIDQAYRIGIGKDFFSKLCKQTQAWRKYGYESTTAYLKRTADPSKAMYLFLEMSS